MNLGDRKENYFLLIKSQKENKREEENQKRQIKNLPIANPYFMRNLRKAVTQLSQKNKIVEEFESDDDSDNQQE